MHEADNPRERNALLMVAATPGGVLGYLPTGVAEFLAPLHKRGLLGSRARVLQLGKTVRAPIDVLLEVRP